MAGLLEQDIPIGGEVFSAPSSTAVRPVAIGEEVFAPTRAARPVLDLHGVTDPNSVKVTNPDGSDATALVSPVGLLTPGTIKNLYDRPVMKNADGSVSTTSSSSWNFGGKEVLLPTVVDGKRLTPQEAQDRYRKTGEHLGIFDTPEHADLYAQALHLEQERQMQATGAIVAPSPHLPPYQLPVATNPAFPATGGRAQVTAVSPRTGQRYQSTAFPDTGLGPAVEGVAQVARGAVGAMTAGAGSAPPRAPVTSGRGFRGAPPASAPVPVTPDQLNAVSDLLEGTFKAGTPLLVPGAINAPASTALAVLIGTVSNYGGAKATAALGGGPEAQRVVGNLITAATVAGIGSEELARFAEMGQTGADAFVAKLQKAARPFVLAAKLSGSGVGVGDVPGARFTEFGELGGPNPETLTEMVRTRLAPDAVATPPESATVQPEATSPTPEAPTPPPAPVAIGEEVKFSPAETTPPVSATPGTTASVPFMITKRMEADLRAAGHTQADINQMTPADAHEALAKIQAAPAPPEVAPAAAPVDEAGRALGGYSGPERRVAEQPSPEGGERRLLPADQVKQDLLTRPDLVRQADTMARPASPEVQIGEEVPADVVSQAEPSTSTSTPTPPAGWAQVSAIFGKVPKATLDRWAKGTDESVREGAVYELHQRAEGALETLGPAPKLADLDEAHLGGLRRIVHELDASGYTPYQLAAGRYGGSLEHVEGTGGAGAKVYDDLLQAGPGTATPTRGDVQAQLERFIAGQGPATHAVRGAIEVARLRLAGKKRIPGDGPLSTPELPVSAGDVPTRLEPRVPTEDVLPTGETQARLPEAGAVREQEKATPEFDIPFSLEAEVDKAAKEFEQDLFNVREPGDDEPQFSRAGAPRDLYARVKAAVTRSWERSKSKPRPLTPLTDEQMRADIQSLEAVFRGHEEQIRDAFNDALRSLERTAVKMGDKEGAAKIRLTHPDVFLPRNEPQFSRARPFAGEWERPPRLPAKVRGEEVGQPAATTKPATKPRAAGDLFPREADTREPQFSRREEPAPIFYSALTRAAEALPQAKGTPEQMAAMLSKGKGVKKEELDWSGVLTWLKEHTGSVTKQAIVDYLRANELQVTETMLGAESPELMKKRGEQFALANDIDEARAKAFGPGTQGNEPGQIPPQVIHNVARWVTEAYGTDLNEHARQRAKQSIAQLQLTPAREAALMEYGRLAAQSRELNDEVLALGKPVKFERHKLPGGERYRELLLTLPAKSASSGPMHEAGARLSQAEETLRAFRDANPDIEHEAGLRNADYRHLVLARNNAGEDLTSAREAVREQQFTAGHFDELNVVAHLRFNDRTDAAGKKVLFIEEVQSDWHQRGRRQGYRPRHERDIARLKAAKLQAGDRYDDAQRAVGRGLSRLDDLGFDSPGAAVHAVRDAVDWRDRFDWRDAPQDLFPKIETMIAAWDEYLTAHDRYERAHGPYGLAGVPDAPFKTTWPELAMKRAIRYAAEHGYDTVAWTTGEQQNARYDLSKHVSQIEYNPKTDRLVALDLDGNRVVDKVVDDTELPDYIGKDATEKLLARPLVRGGAWHELSGLDLKIGGTGMKGFYDQILPAFLNKFGKPFGARVSETHLAGPNVSGIVNDDAQTGAAIGAVPVHALDLTPPMRETALQGLPLFSRRHSPQERLRRQVVAQQRDLQRAYDTIPRRTIGDQRVPVYDVGKRAKPDEVARMLQGPGVREVVTEIVAVTDRVLTTLLGDARSGVKATGVLLDATSYGVFFPHPTSRAQQAVILINPFEYLREGHRDPEAMGDHVFETIVHEATHWAVKGEGPAFKKAYAENLDRLAASEVAARAQLKDAYASPGQPGRIRPEITRALSVYAASRRRPATTRDPLSRHRGYETRPTDDRGGPPGHAADVRVDRGATARTVSRDDLARLAKKHGTTVDEQAARAARAGYTIQSTLVPGAAEFVEQDVLPSLKTASDHFVQVGAQLRRALAPATLGAGRQAAGSLRAMMAAEAQANAKMATAALTFQKQFDRLLAEPGGREKAIDWWDAVQAGHPTKILPELKAAYDYMRAELDKERGEVQKVGKLDEFNAFYFPQIWKFPKEEAQWVRRKLAGLMGRRPFEGSKGFLKQRKYPTFREGLEALTPKGVEPISYNPVDHFQLKMREMRRYRVARQAIQDFKALGIWKAYGGTFGVKPEGWTRIEGALGTIYGPPTVTMEEGFDPDLLKGLETLATDLGVKLSRTVKQPAGLHGNVGHPWGLAMGDRAIWAKAGGPETVLMHEIGHILDERYGLWHRIVNPAPRESHTVTRGKRAGQTIQRAVRQDKATVKIRTTIKKELRALADLRYEGMEVGPGFKKYVRENEEKMANLVHAFIYNPERAKEVAPNSYWALFNTIKAHDELAPIRDLQKTRSLKLGTRAHAIDIGGFPEVGYYAMPDDAARIFNNHLSRGLAGRSAIFDAYRWLNNTMVTGQLAASGLFHLTFTGIDALASQGGLALQELVGGIEQKKPAMVLRGAKRAATVAATGVAGAAAGYAVGGPLGILWASGYPLSALKFIKGWRGKRAWLTEDPAGRFFSDQVRQMNEGGFRPTWDEFYDHGAMKNAMRALRSGNWPGALARTVPAMFDAVTRPVMSWWVPALKTANYLDASAFELERLQNEVKAVEETERAMSRFPATPKARAAMSREQQTEYGALEAERADNLAVIRHALNRVQASMDNRFGEVVYDNWFWERWLKDVTHVVLRSPGWQAGTYKGVLGGLGAQGGRLVQKAKGTAPNESILAADMAWILALVAISMLMGGMTHYLSTGERPEGRDWMYPKGPDGKRRSILTYLPRLVSAGLHPIRTVVGISAPLNTVLARIFATNEKWSGEVIREPGDPWLKQAWDALKFAGEEGYQPFLMQNVQRGEGTVESLMGVAPAASEWQKSDAENYLHDIMPTSSRTHEEQAHIEARRDFREALKTGNTGAAQTAAGQLSRRSIMAQMKTLQRSDLERAFRPTTLPQALHAYGLMTPEERLALKPALIRKWHSLFKDVPGPEKGPLAAQFTKAMALQVAKVAVGQ